MMSQQKLSVFHLLAVILHGCHGCGSRSSPASNPTTTTARPVVEESIVASNAAQNNAWGGGGGIDWSYVAPGGHSSGSKPGTVSTSSRQPVATTPQSVSPTELRTLSKQLVSVDTNSVGNSVVLNSQGRSNRQRSDNAPRNLITLSSPRALDGPTFRALYDLLDNYDPSVTGREDNTRQELQEQETFLNAVMATEVMKKTEQFLRSKGLIQKPLRDVLNELWFTPYSRHRRVLGSSGFEHVFVGEIKNGEVSGFHNWVSFYKEEQEGDLNYLGYTNEREIGNTGSVIKLRFDWTDKDKSIGSMFVGASPELEMALYTVCFYARQGKNCPVEISNYRFNIKTHSQDYKGKKYIGTAYPNI